MGKPDRVSDIAGSDFMFLPQEMDQALIGFVERGSERPGTVEKYACYGYQAMKAVMKHFKTDGDVMYARLAVLCNTPGVVILHKLARKPLWDRIYSNRMKRWELLDSAIVGIGDKPGCDMAVVYSKPLSNVVLSSVQRWSDESAGNLGLKASAMLDNTVAPSYLGAGTPWFLTPVQ